MGTVIRTEPCPECRKRGRDRRGDNLGIYSDGGSHCFSCGYHRWPKHLIREERKERGTESEALPRDFTRDVPAAGWKWLLQYGLPYSYWKPFVGYSEADSRLIFPVGEPTRFSTGRYIPDAAPETGAVGTRTLGTRQPRKWYVYGDRGQYVESVGRGLPGEIVLVEDIVSAHKVGQLTPSVCLFGTNLSDPVLRYLIQQDRPVGLWLDEDQWELLGKKIGRLQTFLGPPVRHIRTEKDPKGHSLNEIREILDKKGQV